MKFLYSAATFVALIGSFFVPEYSCAGGARKVRTKHAGKSTLGAVVTPTATNHFLAQGESEVACMASVIAALGKGAFQENPKKILDQQYLQKHARANDIVEASLMINTNMMVLAALSGYYIASATQLLAGAAFGIISGSFASHQGELNNVSSMLADAKARVLAAKNYHNVISFPRNADKVLGSHKYLAQANEIVTGVLSKVDLKPILDQVASESDVLMGLIEKLDEMHLNRTPIYVDSVPERLSALKKIGTSLKELSENMPHNIFNMPTESIFMDRNDQDEEAAFANDDEDRVIKTTKDKLPKYLSASQEWKNLKKLVEKVPKSMKVAEETYENVKSTLNL